MLNEINTSLEASISQDSLSRWLKLYKRTWAVVCDPSTYLTRGQPFDLDENDFEFIKEFLTDKPNLYSREIQKNLNERDGIQVSILTILNTLHNRLNMTKKCIWKVHPRQEKNQQALYILQVGCIPTYCLVFTGMCSIFLFVHSFNAG